MKIYKDVDFANADARNVSAQVLEAEIEEKTGVKVSQVSKLPGEFLVEFSGKLSIDESAAVDAVISNMDGVDRRETRFRQGSRPFESGDPLGESGGDS